MLCLLQFHGKISKSGVHLKMYKINPDDPYNFVSPEMVECHICNKSHSQLYIVICKPQNMFSYWVVFRYNNEDRVPDLSVPIGVAKIPCDGRKLSPEDNATYWHRS
jgi:hypothetical protein